MAYSRAMSENYDFVEYELLRDRIWNSLMPGALDDAPEPYRDGEPFMAHDVYMFFLAMSRIDLNGVTYALALRAILLDHGETIGRIADFYSDSAIGRELIKRGREEALTTS